MKQYTYLHIEENTSEGESITLHIKEQVNAGDITEGDKKLSFSDNAFFSELKEVLNEFKGKRFILAVNNTFKLDDFNVLNDYAREQKLNITLSYPGNDAVLQEQIEVCNARLKLTANLAANALEHFGVTIDNSSNILVLTVKKDIAFLEGNPAFQELKRILKDAGNGQRVNIQATKGIDSSNIVSLINYISTNKLACDISFESPQTNSQTLSQINGVLNDLYRYTLRKKQIDVTKIVDVEKLFGSIADKQPGKVRRAKQLLNSGARIATHVQHQYHHQHQVQQQNEQQEEQQQQQQQFQNRQNQIQQQQQRMQNLKNDVSTTNIDTLGKLIHEGNLADLVTDDLSLDEIKHIWYGLVGNNARYVEHEANKITHVPESTMRLIIQNREQFSYGIHFDDLPNGFAFKTRDVTTKVDNTEIQNSQSILYFDEKLVKKNEERTDTFLAPRIDMAVKPADFDGSVGQYFPFYEYQDSDKSTINQSYTQFCQANQSFYDQVFSDKKPYDLKTRKGAFLRLLLLDKPELAEHEALIQTSLDELSDKNINGLRCVLQEYGADKVVHLLQRFEKLKKFKQFDEFKAQFLDNSEDWRDLVSDKDARQGELKGLEALDYLCENISGVQRSWWSSMVKQHIQENKSAKFVDLLNAHKYFFEQIKKIDPDLQLPPECPIRGIKNLKVAYARLLYVLNKAIDPREQARHLKNLDFGMQGVICGAARLGPYIFLDEIMGLTPIGSIFDWEKYRPYAPVVPKGQEFSDDKPYVLGNRAFITPMYREKGGIFAFLTGHYGHNYTTQNLARNEHGKIILETRHYGWEGLSYFDADKNEDLFGAFSLSSKELKIDPALQDESIMAVLHNLAYDINLKRLSELSNQLNLFANVAKYFYRYIGTQPYSYSFDKYKAILTTLEQTSFTRDTKENSQFKKQLIPLIAAATAGPRALEQTDDIVAKFDEFLQEIKNNRTELRLYTIEDLNKELQTANPRPTLNEISALLKLTNDSKLISKIIACANQHGANVYQAVINLSKHKQPLDRNELKKFFAYIADLDTGLEKSAKNALILLASLVNKADYGLLDSMTKELKQQKINKDIFDHLNPVLMTANVTESQGLASVEDVKKLFANLAAAKENSSPIVSAITIASLPMIRFTDMSVSSALVYFIHEMAGMSDSIREIINNLQGIKGKFFNDAEAYVDGVNVQDKVPGLSMITNSSLLPIKENKEIAKQFLKNFVDNIIKQLEEINQLFDEVNQGKTAGIKEILKKFDALLKMMENPLNGLTLNGKLGDFAVLAIHTLLTPVIEQVKGYIIKLISENLVKALRVEIADNVSKLGIKNAVLDLKSEENILLDAQLKDFLVAKIPELTIKSDLVNDINNIFKKHEELNAFINVLSNVAKLGLKNRDSRDQVLAYLFRAGYFKEGDKVISLPDLGRIITTLYSFVNIDVKEAMSDIYIPLKFNQIDLNRLEALLAIMRNRALTMTGDEFRVLMRIGVKYGNTLVDNLVQISTFMYPRNEYACRLAYVYMLNCAERYFVIDEINAAYTHLLSFFNENKDDVPLLAHFINDCFEQETGYGAGLNKLASFLDKLKDYKGAERTAVLNILYATCLEKGNSEKVSIEERFEVINKLVEKDKSAITSLCNNLYKYRPSPSFSALKSFAENKEMTLAKWIEAYELDPFGRRDKIEAQYTTRGVDSFVSEIKQLLTGAKIDAAAQEKLVKYFSYIMAVSNHYSLSVGNKLKPIRDFTRAELKDYYQQCRARLKANPKDMTAKLECLALMCEVMFRTSGKYPYHSQILSVINNLMDNDDSILLQIPTGQGKSITLALMAALEYGDKHVTVCTRNELLVQRDYEENHNFFRYLDIPVAFVTAATEENHYQQPTIIYTTTADKSLYDSKLKIVDNVNKPPKENQTIFCDEGDAELFDNKNAFNFSEGNEDPYFNPLEEIYTLANDYIDLPQFRNEDIFDNEDITLFRDYIKTKAPDKYEALKDRLTPAKLSQFLDSACTAKQLKETDAYIVRQETRTVHGKKQAISVAHTIIAHAEDKKATLSFGVQQALHDRLNRQYKDQIELYKEMGGARGIPKFTCDNQIDCVDSQNTHSLFHGYGRIVLCTGTGGTRYELKEATETFNIKHMVDIPPRNRGQLQSLPTVFTDKKASYFFGPKTQFDAINNAIKKAKNQPVMVACKSIEKAEELFKQLKKIYGDKVQVIHAENADDPKKFEKMVEEAAKPGKITVVTPLATRGVDIKTSKAERKNGKAISKLAELAERLLVIETHLDRYRNRKQLIGRTGRDGKKGETLGIFDLNEIAGEHNIELKKKSRKEKLKNLDKIMDKMDKEAQVERNITAKIQSIIIAYEAVFDRALKANSQSTEVRKQILDAKARFIEQSERAWNELIAESDLDGEYPNPYIRYNKDGELQYNALDKEIKNFEVLIKDEIFLQCKDLIRANVEMDSNNLDKTYNYNLKVAGEEDVVQKQVNITTTSASPNLAEIYLELNPMDKDAAGQNINQQSNYNMYKENVSQLNKFFEGLALVNFKAFKIDAALIAQLKEDAVKNMKGQKPSADVYLFAITNSLNSYFEKASTKDNPYNLLNLYALALSRKAAEIQTQAKNNPLIGKLGAASEISMGKTVLSMLAKVLASQMKAIKDPTEKAAMKHLLEIINDKAKTDESLNLTEVHALVSNAFSLAEWHIKSKAVTENLQTIKDFVSAVGGLGEYHKENPSKSKNEFELMVRELKNLLSNLHDNIESRYPRFLHPYAQKKVALIDAFIFNHCSQEAINNLVTKNKGATAEQLWKILVTKLSVNESSEKGGPEEEMKLKDILGYNTHTGKFDSTTNSIKEYKRLVERFNEVFKDSHDDNYVDALKYRNRLEVIRGKLIERKDKGIKFKDQELYKKKLTKLESYIEQFNQLLNNYKQASVFDLETEIRLMKLRFENDPDISSNTSKIYGPSAKGNVTIIKDINKLTSEYLNKLKPK